MKQRIWLPITSSDFYTLEKGIDIEGTAYEKFIRSEGEGRYSFTEVGDDGSENEYEGSFEEIHANASDFCGDVPEDEIYRMLLEAGDRESLDCFLGTQCDIEDMELWFTTADGRRFLETHSFRIQDGDIDSTRKEAEQKRMMVDWSGATIEKMREEYFCAQEKKEEAEPVSEENRPAPAHVVTPGQRNHCLMELRALLEEDKVAPLPVPGPLPLHPITAIGKYKAKWKDLPEWANYVSAGCLIQMVEVCNRHQQPLPESREDVEAVKDRFGSDGS